LKPRYPCPFEILEETLETGAIFIDNKCIVTWINQPDSLKAFAIFNVGRQSIYSKRTWWCTHVIDYFFPAHYVIFGLSKYILPYIISHDSLRSLLLSFLFTFHRNVMYI
jgi:hypothetical protein